MDDNFSTDICQLTTDLLDKLYYDQAVDTQSEKSYSAPHIPDVGLENLKQLLGHYPNGIPSLRLEQEYFNLFKSKLDIQEWGYENLSHMLQLNSDLFMLKNIEGDFVVTDVKESNLESVIDYEVKIKLVRLILKYSKSKKEFPLNKWIKIYREEYNEPNFTLQHTVDDLTLFKTLSKEFPIELYVKVVEPIEPAQITESIESAKSMVAIEQCRPTEQIDLVEPPRQTELLNSIDPPRSIGSLNSKENYKLVQSGTITETANVVHMDVAQEPSIDVDESQIINGGLRLDHSWVNFDKTSSMQSSSIKSSSIQTSSLQTGSMQTGSMQTGSMQTGSMQTGLMQTGLMQTGLMQTGLKEQSSVGDCVDMFVKEMHQVDMPTFDQVINARAKSTKQIFSWRTKMVKQAKQHLVCDLYEMASESSKLPPGVCKPGDTISPFNLLFNRSNLAANIHQAVIVAVSNPQHIFINLMTSSSQIKALTLEMSQYFSNIDLSSYVVPEEFLYEGFPCLVKSVDKKTNEEIWERSKIMNCNSSQAIVESVDFGGFKSVELTQIYLLPKRWALLPGQAIHVSLVGVKQKDGANRWQHEAGARIRDFSWCDYELDCLFIREKKRSKLHTSYDVILCDRHDPDMNLFLDTVLILEGLADSDQSQFEEVEKWRKLIP